MLVMMVMLAMMMMMAMMMMAEIKMMASFALHHPLHDTVSGMMGQEF